MVRLAAPVVFERAPVGFNVGSVKVFQIDLGSELLKAGQFPAPAANSIRILLEFVAMQEVSIDSRSVCDPVNVPYPFDSRSFRITAISPRLEPCQSPSTSIYRPAE